MLQADGGTRTAAVTGSYVALHQALQRLVAAGQLPALPLTDSVAAVSCGVVAAGRCSTSTTPRIPQAETDANFVLTGSGGIVEIQATAEGAPFDEALFAEMLRLARAGIARADPPSVGGARPRSALMPRRFAGERLVIASHNPGKVEEIAALLAPFGVETVSAGGARPARARRNRRQL